MLHDDTYLLPGSEDGEWVLQEDDSWLPQWAFDDEDGGRGGGEEYYPYELLPDFTLPIGIAAVLFFIFILTRAGSNPSTLIVRQEQGGAIQAPAGGPLAFEAEAFAAPYTTYVITQGIHGASYGDMAIDIAGGKGSTVLSPIHGVVTDLYTDRYGNPTLIIENEAYRVKLLHGIYSVSVGQAVNIGDPVGVEGNLGYTTDSRGVRCAGRTDPCGYHTHLNVFDKRLDENVNPLTLLGR